MIKTNNTNVTNQIQDTSNVILLNTQNDITKFGVNVTNQIHDTSIVILLNTLNHITKFDIKITIFFIN